MTLGKRRLSPDVISVLLLTAICWLAFWRLLTPNPANQQSLAAGDFSGQFVAFAQYQAQRHAQGQVPLWNPYNMGGHPFLADTQSAVFYPPRLITIAFVNMRGGSTPTRMYDALEREMIAHTWLASLLMYAFVRRLTRDRQKQQPIAHSVTASLVSALIFAYGGYLSGYPQLQLAVMEAGIWLPLALLGIHEATARPSNALFSGWRWYLLAGFALGMSLMAGHPQTSLFFGYAALAYLGWRTYTARRSFRSFIAGAAIFGLVGAGLSAVQLLPGLEYQALTSRGAIGFDERGNGFPFYDVLQVLFPGLLSLWSPLYIGILGLLLAIFGALRRTTGILFWLILLGTALILSFGSRTILFDLVYNLVPGESWFRGQERAAYLIVTSASVLAGLGTLALLRGPFKRLHALLMGIVIIPSGLLFVVLFAQWASGNAAKNLPQAAFSLVFTLAALIVAIIVMRAKAAWRYPLLVGMLAFELLSFGRTNPNMESTPSANRLPTPPLVQTILQDTSGPFRVQWAGFSRDNFATMFGLQDVDGISPLRMDRVNSLNDIRLFPNVARMWSLFGVRYVMTADEQLPVASTIVARGSDGHAVVNLHRLNDATPFARMVYRTWIEPDDNAARGYLADASFDAANTVMLAENPGITLPDALTTGTATVAAFAPESITIRTSSPDAGILDLALVNYPGWSASIDGQAAPLLRANIAFSAVAVPSGDHTVQLTFAPRSFAIGGLVTAAAVVVLIVGGLLAFIVKPR